MDLPDATNDKHPPPFILKSLSCHQSIRFSDACPIDRHFDRFVWRSASIATPQKTGTFLFRNGVSRRHDCVSHNLRILLFIFSIMGSRNGVNDGKTFGSENQGNSINDEDCSGAATSSRDDTVDPSSKSYSRREALRQSQLTARGQHQPRRTSAANSSSGVYSSGVPGSTPTTIARSPRHAERRRSSSLLQAKADIVAGTSIKSQTDDDCIYKTTGECEMVRRSF